MKLKKEAIVEAFQKNAIYVNIDSLNPYKMEESITNQFFKVLCNSGISYLLRCNGKLWPPFTRENEDFNLNKLQQSQIPTNVVYNNFTQGLQISYLPNDAYQFKNLPMEDKTPTLFSSIGNAIKKNHDIKSFKNNYCILSTVKVTFARITPYDKQILKRFYPGVKRLMATLMADTENFVSSHNDLLPSSIYYKNKQITFVDWEYSGINHRSYDLALFSIKASLTPKQELLMIESYDKNNKHSTFYKVVMMKPIVDFLLLQWHMTSKVTSLESINQFIRALCHDLGNAEQMHACRLPLGIGFFQEQKQREKPEPIGHEIYKQSRL